MNGALFLGIVAALSVGVFLNGLRFARMPAKKIVDGRVQIEMPPFLACGRTAVEQAHLVGRIQMIGAPLFLFFSAALCFGLLGPVEGIQTIQFVSE